MSMKTITNEFIEKVGKFKKLLVSMMCKEDTIMSMNSDALKMTQLSLEMIDKSSELMEEYAKTLEEQNNKLYMILEKLNKEVKA